MLFKKGELVIIDHSRKGRFEAVVTRDFDTDAEEFYPVADEESMEEIACRGNFCSIARLEGAE